MDQIFNNLSPTMIWAGIVTTAIGVFMAIFRQTITNFLTSLIRDRKLYNHRRVDYDGDPATGEFCIITSNTDDSVFYIAFVEDHQWSWFYAFKRIVIYKQFDKRIDAWIKKTKSYTEWRKLEVSPLPFKDEKLKDTYLAIMTSAIG